MDKHIPDIAIEIIVELKENLQNILGDNLNKIILYGSYSRLDYSNDSDIDFIVLTDSNNSELIDLNEKINSLVVDLSLKYNIVLSVILKNSSQFYSYTGLLPYYSNIVAQGITVYG
jgi:predicted nucleotidyltransferase